MRSRRCVQPVGRKTLDNIIATIHVVDIITDLLILRNWSVTRRTALLLPAIAMITLSWVGHSIIFIKQYAPHRSPIVRFLIYLLMVLLGPIGLIIQWLHVSQRWAWMDRILIRLGLDSAPLPRTPPNRDPVYVLQQYLCFNHQGFIVKTALESFFLALFQLACIIAFPHRPSLPLELSSLLLSVICVVSPVMYVCYSLDWRVMALHVTAFAADIFCFFAGVAWMFAGHESYGKVYRAPYFGLPALASIWSVVMMWHLAILGTIIAVFTVLMVAMVMEGTNDSNNPFDWCGTFFAGVGLLAILAYFEPVILIACVILFFSVSTQALFARESHVYQSGYRSLVDFLLESKNSEDFFYRTFFIKHEFALAYASERGLDPVNLEPRPTEREQQLIYDLAVVTLREGESGQRPVYRPSVLEWCRGLYHSLVNHWKDTTFMNKLTTGYLFAVFLPLAGLISLYMSAFPLLSLLTTKHPVTILQGILTGFYIGTLSVMIILLPSTARILKAIHGIELYGVWPTQLHLANISNRYTELVALKLREDISLVAVFIASVRSTTPSLQRFLDTHRRLPPHQPKSQTHSRSENENGALLGSHAHSDDEYLTWTDDNERTDMSLHIVDLLPEIAHLAGHAVPKRVDPYPFIHSKWFPLLLTNIPPLSTSPVDDILSSAIVIPTVDESQTCMTAQKQGGLLQQPLLTSDSSSSEHRLSITPALSTTCE